MMRATFVTGWAHAPQSLEPLATQLADLFSITLCGFNEADKAAGLEADLILGWSMGGMIAQELASKRAIKLVLISSTPCFCSAPDFPCGTPERELKALAVALRRDPAATVTRFIDYAAKPNERLYETPVCDAAALASGLKYLQHTDLRGQATQIAAPALILHGTADLVIPCDASRWLVDHIAGSQFASFEGVGHDLPIRCCKEVANAVRKWLA